jgi:hypothetical protein
MAHTPVNHPLRPIYRALGALTGVYFIVFGAVGVIVNADEGMFWSIVAVLVGLIVLAAAVIGRNSDTLVDKYFGWGLVGVGAYELAVLRTDANFLDFSVATVVVTWLLALVLIMASQYTKVAPAAQAGAPRQEREAQNA